MGVVGSREGYGCPMIWLVLIFSACAVAIVGYTFVIGSKLEQTDRRIDEVRERIGPDDARS